MKLADLKKLAIKSRVRIRFTPAQGLECLIDEHGIARVPELAAVPSFNLEESLAAASRFTVETLDARPAAPPRPVTREQLAAMASAGGPDAAPHDDHDE